MYKIKNSWTWRHKNLLFTLSLFVALLWQNFAGLYMPKPEIIAYRASQSLVCDLNCEIVARADEIYTELEPVNRERARQYAIMEVNEDLYDMTDKSPYVDYEHVRAIVSASVVH